MNDLKIKNELFRLNKFSKDSILIILLHGYGNNEYGMIDVGEYLAPLSFVSIRAVRDVYEAGAIYGYSWFDEPVIPLNGDFDLLQKQLKEGEFAFVNWFDIQVSLGTIDINQKIIIMGFSQGAVMTMYLLGCKKIEKNLIGAICISGYCAFTNDTSIPKNKQKPVFHGYGLLDDVVTEDLSKQTNDWLKDNSKLCTKTYNIAHSISDTEITDIKKWIDQFHYK